MDKLRVALSFFPYSRLRHWPGLAFYFLGWMLHRRCGIALFQNRWLRLKPFTVSADVEGQSGLVFLHEILVQGIYNFTPLDAAGDVRLLYDVGANCGFYALTLCSRHPALRAVCFEPHPVTITRLRDNLAANRLESRVQAVHAAVAAAPGECQLQISPESSMGVVSTSSVQCLEQPAPVRVMAVSLDAHAATQGEYPDLIKIDVEGFEVEALRGARQCLEKARFAIVEVHSDSLARQSLALLREANFQTTQRGDLLFAQK
jgi:FkbM family methyltransferase